MSVRSLMLMIGENGVRFDDDSVRNQVASQIHQCWNVIFIVEPKPGMALDHGIAKRPIKLCSYNRR